MTLITNPNTCCMKMFVAIKSTDRRFQPGDELSCETCGRRFRLRSHDGKLLHWIEVTLALKLEAQDAEFH